MLFLVHRIPYPPNRGDRIRSFHILDFLARRAEVALGFLTEETPSAEALQALKERCGWIGWARWGRWQRWLRAACWFAAGRTITEGLFASRKLRGQLRGWLQEHRPDAVLVFCSSMMQYVHLPGLENVRIVVDLVDVDSQKWLDYAGLSRGWRRWVYQLEGRRLRRLERWIGQRAAAVLLTTPHEAAIYRQIAPEAHIQVLLNGVDTEYFHPGVSPDWLGGQQVAEQKTAPAGRESALAGCRSSLGTAPQGVGGHHAGQSSPQSGAGSTISSKARCVFVGALDYQANIDGLQWFCQEVWPLVRQQRPDAQFIVVGSNPTGAVFRLAEQTAGIQLVGPVPDVRPYLSEAEIVVVPLRVARGIQNKVLEALAMGKPVVASPQALEGLALQVGREAELAHHPSQWAEKLLQLWADPFRRTTLGQAGRRFVETHHQWDQVLQPLGQVLGLPEALGPSEEPSRTADQSSSTKFHEHQTI